MSQRPFLAAVPQHSEPRQAARDQGAEEDVRRAEGNLDHAGGLPDSDSVLPAARSLS